MNGYTQIEVGGKLRGWKWGIYASEKYATMVNKGPEAKMDGDFGTVDIIYIVYAGLCMNCFVKQIDPDFSFEDMVEWIEDFPETELIKIKDAIATSNMFLKSAAKKKVPNLDQLLTNNGGNEEK